MVTDYRLSHLEKGDAYDTSLEQAPLDAFMAEREDAIVRRLVARLFPHGVNRYLDFACGTGRILAAVEPLAREAHGIDVSPSMLAQARRKCPRATVLQADITRELPDIGRFDLITSFRFFGNAQDELRIAVLGALSGLLADGGYLVLNNHRNPRALWNIVVGERDLDLSHAKLARLLASAGFRVVAKTPIGAWVIRGRFNDHRILHTRWASALELLTGASMIAPWAPDAVIVAAKNDPG